MDGRVRLLSFFFSSPFFALAVEVAFLPLT